MDTAGRPLYGPQTFEQLEMALSDVLEDWRETGKMERMCRAGYKQRAAGRYFHKIWGGIPVFEEVKKLRKVNRRGQCIWLISHSFVCAFIVLGRPGKAFDVEWGGKTITCKNLNSTETAVSAAEQAAAEQNVWGTSRCQWLPAAPSHRPAPAPVDLSDSDETYSDFSSSEDEWDAIAQHELVQAGQNVTFDQVQEVGVVPAGAEPEEEEVVEVAGEQSEHNSETEGSSSSESDEEDEEVSLRRTSGGGGGGVVGVDEETEEETEEEEGSSSEVEADVEDAFEAWVQG